jgi:hypothetical protein
MSSGDKLYLKPVGGLCNRMRAIDSAVLLAEQLNKRLVVFWGRDKHLNCKYSDLFKQSEYFDTIEEKHWFGGKAPYPYLPGTQPVSPVKKSLYRITKLSFNIKTELWFEDFESAISFQSNSLSPEKIQNMQDYESKSLTFIEPLIECLNKSGSSFVCTAWRMSLGSRYARHFAPKDILQERVNSMANQFTNTIGVHIRRGDHTEAIKYSGFQKFVAAMTDEVTRQNDTNFFLATDCKATEQKLLKLFPNKLLYFTKSSYSRNSTQGVQEALIDLYCLSKTRRVLGSYFSSFSQVASEISGIKEITVC